LLETVDAFSNGTLVSVGSITGPKATCAWDRCLSHQQVVQLSQATVKFPVIETYAWVSFCKQLKQIKQVQLQPLSKMMDPILGRTYSHCWYVWSDRSMPPPLPQKQYTTLAIN
jgi:hypothetical protein